MKMIKKKYILQFKYDNLHWFDYQTFEYLYYWRAHALYKYYQNIYGDKVRLLEVCYFD